MPKLSQEQIDQAREVDLLAYLLSHESGVLKQEGANYRHREHDSLVYVASKNYWYWNSRGRKINAVDYLMEIRGYSFVDAVERLAGCGTPAVSHYTASGSREQRKPVEKKPFRLPGGNAVPPLLFLISNAGESIRTSSDGVCSWAYSMSPAITTRRFAFLLAGMIPVRAGLPASAELQVT